MTRATRETIEMLASVFVLVSGVLLIMVSLIYPPKGAIDASVNIAFGEALSFVGAVWGINTRYKIKLDEIEHGDKNK